MVKSELVCMSVPVLERRRKAEGLFSPRNVPATGRNTFLSQHVPGISVFGRSGLCLPSSAPLPVAGCSRRRRISPPSQGTAEPRASRLTVLTLLRTESASRRRERVGAGRRRAGFPAPGSSIPCAGAASPCGAPFSCM